MAGYLIYIPGKRQPTPKAFESVGLSGLLMEGDPYPESIDVHEHGPDEGEAGGGRGVLYGWLNRVPKLGVDKDTQEWRPAKADKHVEYAAGRYWLGTTKSDPVTPGSIERENKFDGVHVTLKDGHRWLVPEVLALPGYLEMGEDGELETIPEDRFAAVSKRSHEIREAVATNDSSPVTVQRGFHFCADCLAVNYRINSDLLGMLRLADSQQLADVIAAAVGLSEHYVAQKKTETPAI